MPMKYSTTAIAAQDVPAAADPFLQHLLDTYASETNKVYTVWQSFSADALKFQPHAKSSSVEQIMRHQLLSERRFFAEFLGLPEPAADQVLGTDPTPPGYAGRLVELARPRLAFLAEQEREWWLAARPFFDVERERIWIFWRRVLHTSHHRTQLTVYQRLLEEKVLPTYGPTADVTWDGADPTLTVDAAGRS